MPSLNGVVKMISEDNHYGFISREASQGDIFFHVSNVVGKKAIVVGDVVHFDMGTNHRNGKPCATNIEIAGLGAHETEWFAAVLKQNVAEIRSIAANGQDVNAISREKKACPRCNGSGEGQGGYSFEDIRVSRRIWICGACSGKRFTRPITAVQLAVQHDKTESLKALLDLGADVDKQRPLLEAMEAGKEHLVLTLLDARASPNFRDENGTPLFLAAKRGQVSMVTMLLEAGAMPDDRVGVDYGDGELEFITAEEIARQRKHLEVAQAIHDWKQRVE